jgi:hypothetical protein
VVPVARAATFRLGFRDSSAALQDILDAPLPAILSADQISEYTFRYPVDTAKAVIFRSRR